jgi:hypothetical protein
MNLNFFNGRRSRNKSAASTGSPVRLGVETLEDRLVPTAWIQGWDFPLYDAQQHSIGTLSIVQQSGSSFSGVVHDNGFNANIPVSGQLQLLGGSWDRITFGGGPSWFGYGSESVSFNGYVNENMPHTLMGSLNESGSFWRAGVLGGGWVNFADTYSEYSTGYYPIY